MSDEGYGRRSVGGARGRGGSARGGRGGECGEGLTEHTWEGAPLSSHENHM